MHRHALLLWDGPLLYGAFSSLHSMNLAHQRECTSLLYGTLISATYHSETAYSLNHSFLCMDLSLLCGLTDACGPFYGSCHCHCILRHVGVPSQKGSHYQTSVKQFAVVHESKIQKYPVTCASGLCCAKGGRLGTFTISRSRPSFQALAIGCNSSVAAQVSAVKMTRNGDNLVSA
jgi:hypothetical protein